MKTKRVAKGENRSSDPVIICPRTPGGRLGTLLRKAEEKINRNLKLKVTLVEEGEDQIKIKLYRSDSLSSCISRRKAIESGETIAS